MIVYFSTKSEFRQDVCNNQIEELIPEKEKGSQPFLIQYDAVILERL